MTRVVIIGGGPGGYEAALVAAQLGAEVCVVDRDGLGGSAVLTDCVPSKTLVATAEVINQVRESGELGVRIGGSAPDPGDVSDVSTHIAKVNARVKALAHNQSEDVGRGLQREGVRVVRGSGRMAGPDGVVVSLADGGTEELAADVVLLSTGARPRILPDAEPDGERILTWDAGV